MPSAAEALPGRTAKMTVPSAHFVNGHPIEPPFPDGLERAMFGMGCFWGAERKFWQLDGVYSTAVGYAAGITPNPTYREVCTGMTGHNEVVLVVFDPASQLRRIAARVLGEPRPDAGNATGQRRRYPIPVRDLLLFRRAANARRSRAGTRFGRAAACRLRSDHDRNPAGSGVLLRRGLPSAIPREESRTGTAALVVRA